MVLNTFKDRKLTEISTALSSKFAEHRVNEIQKAARQVGQVTSATNTIKLHNDYKKTNRLSKQPHTCRLHNNNTNTKNHLLLL